MGSSTGLYLVDRPSFDDTRPQSGHCEVTVWGVPTWPSTISVEDTIMARATAQVQKGVSTKKIFGNSPVVVVLGEELNLKNACVFLTGAEFTTSAGTQVLAENIPEGTEIIIKVKVHHHSDAPSNKTATPEEIAKLFGG